MSALYLVRARRRPVLMLDADDTLWPCTCFYEQARQEMAAAIDRKTAIGYKLAYELVLATSKVSVQQPDGFLRYALERRFRAAAAAALELCGMPNGKAYTDWQTLGYDAQAIAENLVWNADYRLFDGALDLIQGYRESGWLVVITTKGDSTEQYRKIEKNNLLGKVDGWHITPQKTPDFYEQVGLERLADSHRSFVVGDSLSSDVAPAQTIGLRTVWITGVKTGADLPVPKDVVPEFAIPSVLELPTVVPFDPDAVPPRAKAANAST